MNQRYGFGIEVERLPKHIAIIMDGNGRWAKKRFMPRTFGHRAGMATLKEIVRTCSDNGIQVLTVYAFSTENWKRPNDEVSYLMDLLVEYMGKEIEELHQNNVKIMVSGEIEVLPQKCRRAVREALQKTACNTGLVFNLAMNYGARYEITRAARAIAEKVHKGEMNVEDIDEAVLNHHLYTTGLPDPDLLIRTAGDYRVSNFLLWQIAYTELVFIDVAWPDFKAAHLEEAVRNFAKRDRRFGGLPKTQQEGK